MNNSTTGSLVLEPSTNTHVMHGVKSSEKITESILTIKTDENARIVHGEHGTLGIESRFVVKTVQHELNPVTKGFQQVFD
jgi:hypothetical protein